MQNNSRFLRNTHNLSRDLGEYSEKLCCLRFSFACQNLLNAAERSVCDSNSSLFYFYDSLFLMQWHRQVGVLPIQNRNFLRPNGELNVAFFSVIFHRRGFSMVRFSCKCRQNLFIIPERKKTSENWRTKSSRVAQLGKTREDDWLLMKSAWLTCPWLLLLSGRIVCSLSYKLTIDWLWKSFF